MAVSVDDVVVVRVEDDVRDKLRVLDENVDFVDEDVIVDVLEAERELDVELEAEPEVKLEAEDEAEVGT